MSPLWMEEDEGTCSSPPIRVSSFSDTTSKVCRVWLMPALAFIWSEVDVISRLVCMSWAPVFPFSSSSTQEPWQHKVRKGGRERREIKLVVFKCTPDSSLHTTQNKPSPFKWKQLIYRFLAQLTPLHPNGLAGRCISLCHCPTNSLHIFPQRSVVYIIS